MRERPLSPHLSVYRFKYTLTTSILNRITGLALSVAFVPLIYWLVAAASGGGQYARALRWLSSLPARAIALLLLLAFCYHLIAGIRHLVWDTGRGLEREQARRSAWIVSVGSLVLALALALWWLATAEHVR
jgi:succinate dehydrogenase / fumarate reductase, cytochrome b subunit